MLNLSHISDIIDRLSNETNWSIGNDGAGGICNPICFLILEEIYNIIGNRKEVSSIKFFKNIEDPLAYEWHTDNENNNERLISSTILVYTQGCEGSVIEFVDRLCHVKPYDIILIDKNTKHRAVGNFHGPVIKYTLL